MWLLTYEADRRGWLRPPGGSVVMNDRNFGPLRAADIAFFDENVKAPTKTLLFGVPSMTLQVYGETLDVDLDHDDYDVDDDDEY
jgi:hypothetical protein